MAPPITGWGVLENYEVVRKIGTSLPFPLPPGERRRAPD